MLVCDGMCFNSWTGELLEDVSVSDIDCSMQTALINEERVHMAEAGPDGTADLEREVAELTSECTTLLNRVLRVDPTMAFRGKMTEMAIRVELKQNIPDSVADEADGRAPHLASEARLQRAESRRAALSQRRGRLQEVLSVLLSMRLAATPGRQFGETVQQTTFDDLDY